MEERNKEVISNVEEVLRDFMFMEYDKIEIEGLDSIIALKLQNIDEIMKCEVQTKVLEKHPSVKTETYVLVKWEDSDDALTFKCMTTAVNEDES